MTVPSSLNTPNATAASNDPQGFEAVFPSLDDYLCAHASFIAQIRDHQHEYLSTVAGTVNAITGTTSSGAPNALSAGQVFWFKASGANTSPTPTININTIGAKTIKRQDGSALAAGDIPASGKIVLLGYDGTDMIYLNCPRVTKADLATTATSATTATRAGGSYLGQQVFSTAGTYTITTNPNATAWIVKVIGSTSGGGASAAAAGGQYSIGQSASGGSYVEARYTSTLSGATLVVGAKGAGGVAPSGNGSTGTSTTLTSASSTLLLTVPAGVAGTGNGVSSAFANANQAGASAPSAATVTGGGTQILNITGQEGGALWISSSSLGFRGGSGGSAMSQGVQGSASGHTDGVSASRPGQGGTGAFTGAADTARNGGDGYDAYVVIEEYA